MTATTSSPDAAPAEALAPRLLDAASAVPEQWAGDTRAERRRRRPSPVRRWSGRWRLRGIRASTTASLVRRLLALQVALVGIRLGLGPDPDTTATAVGIALAAVVVVVLFVPWRGRTAASWAADGIRFRGRRGRAERAGRAGRAGHVSLPLAEAVVGGRRVRESADPAGRRAAVVVDGTRWIGVGTLHAAGPGPIGSAGASRLPIGALWDAVTPAVRDAALLQVVVQRTAASESRPRWRTWVCLGVDAELAGDAVAARGGGQAGVTATVLVESARIGARAALLGLRLEPLDAATFRRAVEDALASPDGSDSPLVERWGHCVTGASAHRTYRQTRWAGSSALATVLGGSATAAATCVTASLTLRHDDDARLTVVPMLRVTAPEDQLARLDGQLNELGRATDTRWAPLDGAQLTGLQATVPMGRLA
ncbi:MAG: type VII secretion protein EccE [Dermatophilaceae bacterium]